MIQHLIEFLDWHQMHSLGFPPHVCRRSIYTPCHVIARVGQRTGRVSEKSRDFHFQASFFVGFPDSVCLPREPFLDPSLGKCRRITGIPIGRRHDPDATVWFNGDDTCRFFLASRAYKCRLIELQLSRYRRPSL
jgi:hypothetical protein